MTLPAWGKFFKGKLLLRCFRCLEEEVRRTVQGKLCSDGADTQSRNVDPGYSWKTCPEFGAKSEIFFSWSC